MKGFLDMTMLFRAYHHGARITVAARDRKDAARKIAGIRRDYRRLLARASAATPRDIMRCAQSRGPVIAAAELAALNVLERDTV